MMPATCSASSASNPHRGLADHPLRTADFDYALPAELIAQTPVEPRDASRLLVLRRDDGRVEHRRFMEIGDYLRPGDVLVANDSKVFPARLQGRRQGSGGRIELLLLRRDADGLWEAAVRPGRRLGVGARVDLGDGEAVATILERTEVGTRRLTLDPEAVALRLGAVPLPPYIREPLANAERYQTVYARAEGSAAAPTAGLHFTPQFMADLEAKGIGFAFITLHVGLDTFRPVRTEDPRHHRLHAEWAELSPEVAARLNGARSEGRRLVAVGTTTVRVLESASRGVGELALSESSLRPLSGWVDLLILPGHRFRAVDALITNFHLPKTTLLMLVCAFAGRERVLSAYAEAIRQRYRFYSFGDAMLVL